MIKVPMYPLRFEPIYQYRLWGGRRLADLLTAPLPGDGPIGEAWLLSDRDDHSSKVADGPLKGSTIRQLMEQSPDQLLGKLAGRFRRFPVLLKFLDAHAKLSVQVHPEDGQKDYIPAGESGKSEAWVVLEAGPASRIYAGLKPGTTQDDLKRALASRAVADLLASFTPRVGDAVFVRAGTVHSLSGLVVFEVQENSDVTFRLYDWDRVDPKTGKPRPLQVEQAIACIDFKQVAIGPVAPVEEEAAPVRRERLFHCEHFSVWRHSGQSPFTVGAAGTPRVLVGIVGEGELEHSGTTLSRRPRRRRALAGGGRCMFVPAAQCSQLAGGRTAGIVPAEDTMKKLVVFDLDGTLAQSKASLDAEMAALLNKLLGLIKVAVISGGDWPQFHKQVLSHLTSDERLKNLSLLPTCGTQFYKYETGWEKLYAEDFTSEQKKKIISSLKQAIEQSGLKAEKVWGEVIQDRGSQITFSALGQEAPLEAKVKWDPDFTKRKKMKAILDTLIPEFSVRLGGSTSIDVTKPGIDKAYGIRKLRDILVISIEEMIFVGDALFPGGNDYPAEQAGVDSIRVKEPHETKRVIEAIIACLS